MFISHIQGHSDSHHVHLDVQKNAFRRFKKMIFFFGTDTFLSTPQRQRLHNNKGSCKIHRRCFLLKKAGDMGAYLHAQKNIFLMVP